MTNISVIPDWKKSSHPCQIHAVYSPNEQLFVKKKCLDPRLRLIAWIMVQLPADCRMTDHLSKLDMCTRTDPRQLLNGLCHGIFGYCRMFQFGSPPDGIETRDTSHVEIVDRTNRLLPALYPIIDPIIVRPFCGEVCSWR